MNIRQIDPSNRQEARRFVDFPNDLYRHCPQWVPYPRQDKLAHLNRRNAFFAHSQADFFVAEAGGQTLGRICVMENRNYNTFHQAGHAFFYLFDVIDDVAAARALFEGAIDWSHRRGLNVLVGPK